MYVKRDTVTPGRESRASVESAYGERRRYILHENPYTVKYKSSPVQSSGEQRFLSNLVPGEYLKSFSNGALEGRKIAPIDILIHNLHTFLCLMNVLN